MPTPYAVTEPFDGGLLDVGDGHRMAWDVAGNPAGKPALIVHGGPGAALGPRARRMFDPARYLIVQLDQRQCGRSTPRAAEPVVDLSTNTTAHLLADIEQLRTHLGVERWLLWGGSWGTVLALAYAEQQPQRVSELVLASVVGHDRDDIDWVTRQMGRVFPAEWQRFRDHVPAADRDGDLAVAYARLLQDPDPAVHRPAAREWCAWEDTHVSLAPGSEHDDRFDDPTFALTFARLVTHYWANACFLDDGQVLRHADRLRDIPIVMVQGRYDVSGPLRPAWRLQQELPRAELTVVDEGHGGGSTMMDVIVAATDRFASRTTAGSGP